MKNETFLVGTALNIGLPAVPGLLAACWLSIDSLQGEAWSFHSWHHCSSPAASMNTDQKHLNCSCDYKFSWSYWVICSLALRQEAVAVPQQMCIIEAWKAVGRNKYFHFPYIFMLHLIKIFIYMCVCVCIYTHTPTDIYDHIHIHIYIYEAVCSWWIYIKVTKLFLMFCSAACSWQTSDTDHMPLKRELPRAKYPHENRLEILTFSPSLSLACYILAHCRSR